MYTYTVVDFWQWIHNWITFLVKGSYLYFDSVLSYADIRPGKTYEVRILAFFHCFVCWRHSLGLLVFQSKILLRWIFEVIIVASGLNVNSETKHWQLFQHIFNRRKGDFYRELILFFVHHNHVKTIFIGISIHIHLCNYVVLVHKVVVENSQQLYCLQTPVGYFLVSFKLNL